jgi:MoxR-like ATPase
LARSHSSTGKDASVAGAVLRAGDAELIEQVGRYPLAEAQLDRFMVQLTVEYPSREEEERIVAETGDSVDVRPVLTAAQLPELLHLVRRLPAAPSVVSYAVKLARSTRPDSPEAPANIKKYVSWGAAPRASQYLILGAKARAAMDGRAMPDLEDVAAMAQPVLSHRVAVNFQAEAEGVSAASLIEPLAK